MGPVYGEPLCPCQMRETKTARSQACIDAVAQANKRFDELMSVWPVEPVDNCNSPS